MDGISRRNFLSAAAAGGFFSGSGAIRTGVIGCGGRGEAAAINAMKAGPDVRIVALADLLRDRAEEVRAKLRSQFPGQVDVPNERIFTGFGAWRQVIEASDVVLIANAARFHPMHLRAAIEAGRHVFVEKPHAIDPAGLKVVREACALAKQKRLSVVSGLQSRYHPGYRETMARVHGGAIGAIIAIH